MYLSESGTLRIEQGNGRGLYVQILHDVWFVLVQSDRFMPADIGTWQLSSAGAGHSLVHADGYVAACRQRARSSAC
jgi:hypothetical protein